MAKDDDEMFMTKSLNVTPNTTEQHLMARGDKSVAYVTKNKTVLDVLHYWSYRPTQSRLLKDVTFYAASLSAPPCITFN